MINHLKNEFSERMNYVADKLKVPPKGNNRQAAFGKLFGVSQEAARKWLEGESIPKNETCIKIALKAQVSFEWLMTGRGIADYGNTPEAKVLMAMKQMDEPTKYQVVKISNTLAEPAEPNNKHDTQ